MTEEAGMTSPEALEPLHKAEYDTLRAKYTFLQEWCALSEDQREKVRELNHEKWQYVQNLGEKISRGDPL